MNSYVTSACESRGMSDHPGLAPGLFLVSSVATRGRSRIRPRDAPRPLARLTYMGELDILLRQLRDDPDPDPMADRLMEMYREWCRKNGITPNGSSTLGK